MTDDERVACILRRDGEILLRADADGVTLPTTTVDGTVDGGSAERPPAAARRLAGELVDGWRLVRAGSPVEFADGVVRPFLFDCAEVRRDGPSITWEPPTALLDGGIDGPWRAYEAVAPTVETVAADGTHGAAYLSYRALEVLRDGAAVRARGDSSVTWPELAELATALLASRPSMAAVSNRVNRAMAAAVRDRTARAVATAAAGALEAAIEADERAAALAAERIRDRTVVTISRSGTVLEALVAGDPAEAIILESRPAREGIGVAEDVAAAGHSATLIIDAAIAHVVATRDPDVAIVGADTVLPSGDVVNKVGTRTMATVATHAGIPVVVAAAADKISPRYDPALESIPRGDVYQGDAAVSVESPMFDRTPSSLIDEIVTESGRLGPDGVDAIAEAHDRRSRWQDDGSP